MVVHSVDVPDTGTFTLLGLAGEYRVRIVFSDRCRLEFPLTQDLRVDRHSVFKFLDATGTVHRLSWASQSADALGLTPYLDLGLWFVRQLQTATEPELPVGLVERELARIRTARAVHLRCFDAQLASEP